MATTLNLVPDGTRVTASGNGEAFDVSGSATRTFLVTMRIADQMEQESIDLSIWGSADGKEFGLKPILKLPQRFYRGETKQVLDLTLLPEVKFIRARWDLNRWGRVAPEPMFVIRVAAEEVPAFPKRSAAPAAASA